MTNQSANAIDLSKTPIHIPSTLSKDKLEVLDWFKFDGPSFGRYVSEFCDDQNPARIVMIETSPVSWPTWERHTEGDELVVVIEGSGIFIQQVGDEEVMIAYQAGDTILNPKNVWHTANVETPTKALYITPCPGTEHKPRET